MLLWSRIQPGWTAAAVSAATMLAAPDASAATVPGQIVAIEGSTPIGSVVAVANVRPPFVNAAGQVAFTGTVVGGNGFLFIDDQVVWLATDDVPPLTSIAPHISTFESGAFVLSANTAGTGVLWTDSGALVMDGDAAPGFPLAPAATFTGLQRPTAAGGGDVVWRGLVDTTGDGFSNAVGLFRRPAVGGGAIEALYVSGEVVDGVEIVGSLSGVNSDFAVSDDGTHVLVQLAAAGSSLTDSLVVLDGTIVAREGDPVPSFPAESWGSFDLSSVNDGGNYVFSGDSSAATNADEFVALNGDIVFHEGDLIDGVPVTFAVRFVAINDNDNIAIGWASNSGGIVEHVFVACRADSLATDARLLISTNDELDLDADGVGDVTVQDLVFATNDPGRTLGDPGAVFLEVDLDPGDLNAIVQIPLGCCGNGEVDGGEECDDGNDDETDACLSACEEASCGDGFLQEGVEACDDGNTEDGDGCDASCNVEDPVMGTSTGSTTSTGTTTGNGSSTGPTPTSSSSGAEVSTGPGETGDASAGGASTTGATGDGSTSSSSSGDAEDTSGTDTEAAVGADEGCGCTTEQDERPPLLWTVLFMAGFVTRRRRT